MKGYNLDNKYLTERVWRWSSLFLGLHSITPRRHHVHISGMWLCESLEFSIKAKTTGSLFTETPPKVSEVHLTLLSLKAHFQHFRSSHVALSDSNFHIPGAPLRNRRLLAVKRCHVPTSAETLRHRFMRPGCRIQFFFVNRG